MSGGAPVLGQAGCLPWEHLRSRALSRRHLPSAPGKTFSPICSSLKSFTLLGLVSLPVIANGPRGHHAAEVSTVATFNSHLAFSIWKSTTPLIWVLQEGVGDNHLKSRHDGHFHLSRVPQPVSATFNAAAKRPQSGSLSGIPPGTAHRPEPALTSSSTGSP